MARLLIFSFCFLVMSFAVHSAAQEGEPVEEEQGAEVAVENQKVEALFEAYRTETDRDRSFPELGFDDIPALLEYGKSKRVLKQLPSNPISSQYEPTCSEGMVALWLVEGVRKGGRFPSLNALCFKKGRAGDDWTSDSQINHDQVLEAYQKWWAEVKDLPVEQAKDIDPLQGTDLHWY